ncbi:4-hydroxythreonine-4-phosphate dehydrogenase PdxA [Synechococcus sp. PCC 7336]|uniref:4-hydroxythreonine-4-phosphate dehydrogenase PdxA n=1 Tax=Synechococcus sp. PCC 7336 TaxID=195250 RepID=UPI000345D265|nr:4-hydroxythreonine-4-phosphate dehydrogenase PdxA [Synechococcus sp. PCC 7336]
MKSLRRSRLALTLGDPAGIGPEIILKALAEPSVRAVADIVVVGDRDILQAAYQRLQTAVENPLAHPDDLAILDCQTGVSISLGIGDRASGAASFTYLSTAIDRTLAGEFDGIVTAPIAKFAWAAAGHRYPGQTEVLAGAAQTDRFGMLFVARSPLTQWRAIVLLATTHIPLCQVPQALTPALVGWKLDLLAETLQQDFGISDPTIAVAGLNPHSGEGGQLGREEVDWLTEAIAAHPQARGPIPPDTIWVEPGRAWYETGRASADAYLALYHDQGLIPVKLMAFDRAVNVTIGLPFVRTSPDHGTAFDIAARGCADDRSLRAAILLAAELSQRRSVLRA